MQIRPNLGNYANPLQKSYGAVSPDAPDTNDESGYVGARGGDAGACTAQGLCSAEVRPGGPSDFAVVSVRSVARTAFPLEQHSSVLVGHRPTFEVEPSLWYAHLLICRIGARAHLAQPTLCTGTCKLAVQQP
jgi:hypothetical protein